MNIDKKLFADLLAQMESGGSYIDPPGGAIGKYQFMPTTLNALRDLYGLPDWIDETTFMMNPGLQEQYFDAHYLDLTSYFHNANLQSYLGSTVQGSKRFPGEVASLNVYGILAGMHLAGSGSIKRYFSTGYNPDDGFTSLTDYMVYFSNKLGPTITNSDITAILALGIITYVVYILL